MGLQLTFQQSGYLLGTVRLVERVAHVIWAHNTVCAIAIRMTWCA